MMLGKLIMYKHADACITGVLDACVAMCLGRLMQHDCSYPCTLAAVECAIRL